MEQTQSMSFKKTASRLGFGYFFLMFITQILASVFALVMQVVMPEFFNSSLSTWLVSYLPLYLVAFPIFLLIVKTIPTLPTSSEYSKITIGATIKCLVICFGFMYIFNFVSGLINMLLGLVLGQEMINPIVQITSSSSLLLNIIVGVIIAPIGEEIIFRYIPYKKLGAYGDKVYIIFSATCFALFHGNISQMLYAFALGAIFAYVLCRTGKLRYTIILHIVVNALGMIVAPLASSSDIGLIILGLFVMIMMLASLTTFAVMWQRRQFKFNLPTAQLPEHPWRNAFLNSGMIFNITMCIALILLVIISPFFA